MSDRPWWMIVGQWALWFVAMALVMGLIDRTRRKARRRAKRNTMRMPLSIFITGGVCFLFFAGIAVMYPNKTVTWWTTAEFLFFAAIGLPIMTGYFLEQHRLSDEGIAFRNFIGLRRTLSWEEFRKIRYAPLLRWFRL